MSPAAYLAMLKLLAADTDEDGNPVEPIISREQFRELLLCGSTVSPVCPLTASNPDNATDTDSRNTLKHDIRGD